VMPRPHGPRLAPMQVKGVCKISDDHLSHDACENVVEGGALLDRQACTKRFESLAKWLPAGDQPTNRRGRLKTLEGIFPAQKRSEHLLNFSLSLFEVT
jgi:hypothetical protein